MSRRTEYLREICQSLGENVIKGSPTALCKRSQITIVFERCLQPGADWRENRFIYHRVAYDRPCPESRPFMLAEALTVSDNA